MISKELSEILDALTRETGESLLPYQELEIFGLGPLGESSSHGYRNSKVDDDDIDYDNDSDDDYDDYDDYEEYDNGEVDEEYEFDENDEEYALLTQVLRLNNCRKKYFA